MYDKLTTQEKEALYIEASRSYSIGTPIMSDEEFDQLEILLNDNPVVQKTHEQHAGAVIDQDTYSIRPLHTLNDVVEWVRYQPVDEFFSSLKIDGVLAKIQTGVQFRAESRGRDDNVPWDYTEALKYIIPQIKETHFIRGEVFLPKEHLEFFRGKYNNDIYKVERTAGITVLRRPQDHTIDDIKKLKFLAYYIDGNFTTKKEMFDKLHFLGFETPESKLITITDAEADLADLQSKYEETELPTDGIVLEYNDLSLIPEVEGKYLSTQIAMKLGRWGMTYCSGIVTDAKFSPGKGHYGVVLEIEPVVTQNGFIQRNVNCFNIGTILKYQIEKNTEIIFERQSNGMCYFKGVVE